MTQAPEIRIQVDAGAIRIQQHRPSVAKLLRGLEVPHALDRIPKLLSICGHAQSIAAERAVAAATGQEETTEERRDRAARLSQEQARAAVWRLALDWPDLVGEPKDLDWLRAARAGADAEDLLAALRRCMHGLAEHTDVDALIDWISTADCQAARVVRRAQELNQSAPPQANEHRIDPLCGEELRDVATQVLATESFDPLDPGVGAVEVGPVAMMRDPRIASLHGRTEVGPLARRLLAQLLDVQSIMRALATPRATATEPAQWPLDERLGLGRAMTARGPVFHRVTLDRGGGRVLDWRILAPTDWHFAPGGPLATWGDASESYLRFLVTAFDPCAPWSLVAEGREAYADA